MAARIKDGGIPVEVRPLGEDAISIVIVGGVGKSMHIPFDKLQTFIFVKRAGCWFCAAFQNIWMSRASKPTFDARTMIQSLGALLSRLQGHTP
ncbi:MAG: hypothetical protein BGN95_09555 [Sphingomonas sp. 66-10]|uniref:hypothetical protein n=1 Tax=Sphingomonas sp. 66-10 TaxID=1895848 RepID=UPI0009268C2E|nr:hypothetical protein [Sphingomonas sp. 66-10]OJU22428.1 MAG: hypothetical protein BGN95_09555 [Sphingomonas sp. 66-10]